MHRPPIPCVALHRLLLPLALACFALTAVAADSGDSLDLARFRGKVVVVDFWASWCAPCRHSFPWLNEMQAKYARPRPRRHRRQRRSRARATPSASCAKRRPGSRSSTTPTARSPRATTCPACRPRMSSGPTANSSGATSDFARPRGPSARAELVALAGNERRRSLEHAELSSEAKGNRDESNRLDSRLLRIARAARAWAWSRGSATCSRARRCRWTPIRSMPRSTITSISARKPPAAGAASAAAAAAAIDRSGARHERQRQSQRRRLPLRRARCSAPPRAAPVKADEADRWSFDTALLYYGESDDRVQDVSAAIAAQRAIRRRAQARSHADCRHAHRRVGERRDRARRAADVHQPVGSTPCTRRRPAKCRSTTRSSTRASR